MPKRAGLTALTTTALAAALSLPAAASAAQPSFADPTASLGGRANIELGELVYVGPFARISAGRGTARSVTIGDESNVQDNVRLDGRRGRVRLGSQAILAHGAVVERGASVGLGGSCPGGGRVCPSFVGFNAEIDGGRVERNAMVSHLARVGRGVTIPSGRRVLPGKNVSSQAQVASETVVVTQADREFMRGVIEVNTEFAREYVELAEDRRSNVRGVNFDPGNSDFNPRRNLPRLAGRLTRAPSFRNRIVGAVRLEDRLARLDDVMGRSVSLRADEGEPFVVGTIARISRGAIFHALEGARLDLGDRGRYGSGSLIHGGPTAFSGGVKDSTSTGDRFRLGSGAVFFRSRIGDNGVVGARSLVQGSDLAAGTVVPPRTVVIDGQVVGAVEW